MMKSHTSASKSSIRKVWHFNVLTNAEVVCEARVNFSQLLIFFHANSGSSLPLRAGTMVCYPQLQPHLLDNLQLNPEVWNQIKSTIY